MLGLLLRLFLGPGLVVVLLGGLGVWWRIACAVRRRRGSLMLGWVWVWRMGWERWGRRGRGTSKREVGGRAVTRWGKRGSSRGGFGAGWSGCGGRSAHRYRVSIERSEQPAGGRCGTGGRGRGRGTCLPLETAGVEAREAGSGVVGLGEDVEGREGFGGGVAGARREVGGAVVGHEGEGVEEALQGAGDLPGAGGGGGGGGGHGVVGWGGRAGGRHSAISSGDGGRVGEGW